MTKANLTDFYRRYKASTATTLDDVYQNPSIFKRRAFREWQDRARTEFHANLFSLRIVSHNAQMFTLGFVDDSKIFHFVTASNHYTAPVSELEG